MCNGIRFTSLVPFARVIKIIRKNKTIYSASPTSQSAWWPFLADHILVGESRHATAEVHYFEKTSRWEFPRNVKDVKIGDTVSVGGQRELYAFGENWSARRSYFETLPPLYRTSNNKNFNGEVLVIYRFLEATIAFYGNWNVSGREKREYCVRKKSPGFCSILSLSAFSVLVCGEV